MRYDTHSAAPHLRSGPNGPPRDRVQSIQRRRIIAAAVDTVNELGYARTTVAQVIARASVSRKTFYDSFGDREDCFLAAFEQAVAEARLLAKEAYDRENSWRAGIRAALQRLLLAIDEEPHLAKLVVVESLAAGQTLLRRRRELLGELADLIDEGRSLPNSADQPAQLTSEGVAGCIAGLLYAHLLQQRGEPLADLLGPMMSIIVLPYRGAAAARGELMVPTVRTRREESPPRAASRRDPLAGLDMRLTYRTLRVLTAIAKHPGDTNRKIGERSGIADDGQTSKLLSRLAAMNLIENVGEPYTFAPKAWRLTELGQRLERAAGRNG